MNVQVSMKPEADWWQSEAGAWGHNEVLQALGALSDSERLTLLWLMRRGNPHFNEWCDDIRGLWSKGVVFPIDDNQEIYAVRGNIWAAREQYLNTHKDKKTPELF